MGGSTLQIRFSQNAIAIAVSAFVAVLREDHRSCSNAEHLELVSCDAVGTRRFELVSAQHRGRDLIAGAIVVDAIKVQDVRSWS
jgi:hypothetical protein